ncbi:hypothetical protein NSQ89_14720 [Niallia sp. FSL R7-0648]|uniref:hypothetical protein n=1 Tax=Niallia sp. FSL R7-0648 TaxID=2954521 RepID=UPI0030FA5327
MIEDIYNLKNSYAYKTTILRLIHEGKYDNFATVKEWIGNIDNIQDDSVREIYNNIAKVRNKKTSGWVTHFINDFFENNDFNNDSLTYEDKIGIFKENFPELNMIITSIRLMYNK